MTTATFETKLQAIIDMFVAASQAGIDTIYDAARHRFTSVRINSVCSYDGTDLCANTVERMARKGILVRTSHRVAGKVEYSSFILNRELMLELLSEREIKIRKRAIESMYEEDTSSSAEWIAKVESRIDAKGTTGERAFKINVNTYDQEIGTLFEHEIVVDRTEDGFVWHWNGEAKSLEEMVNLTRSVWVMHLSK